MLGLASAATMPLAVAGTRWSDAYELLHAAFAVPVALLLGGGALAAARAARRIDERTLVRLGQRRAVRAGRALGVLGVSLALAAAIAVGVYGLLEYTGSRS